MTDELARVKPKSFHDKNANPERYCVAIGCLEYEPCSIHLGPRITDDELARVKRIGSTPASRRALYEEALEQDRAMRQTIIELRAQKTELREQKASLLVQKTELLRDVHALRTQNAELLAALRELHRQSGMVPDYDEDLVHARDHAGAVIAKAERT